MRCAVSALFFLIFIPRARIVRFDLSVFECGHRMVVPLYEPTKTRKSKPFATCLLFLHM